MSLANGLSCEIREMVQLHFLLGTFSWTHQFKILQEWPFAIILGLDFLGHSQMVVDLAKRENYFGFAPDKVMKFLCLGKGEVSRVADTLSTMFEGKEGMVQDEENLAVLEGLPLVYTSLEEAQEKDTWCKSVVEDLKKG